MVYFVAFLFQKHACLSVTSHASVYLDLCQQGNLLNKTVNHLEFTNLTAVKISVADGKRI